MKKLFLVLLAAFCFNALKAQEAKVGVFAGMNISSPSEWNSRLGFHIGVKGELQFNNRMYVDVVLSLTAKGGKSGTYYDLGEQQSMTWKSTPYYLEIPAHIGYRIPVGENLTLFGSVGPYIGWGLLGEYSCKTEANSTETKTISDNLFKDNLQKSFDWGLGLNFGVEFYNHYQLSLGYNLGLQNINEKKDIEVGGKNRVFNISVGYMF